MTDVASLAEQAIRKAGSQPPRGESATIRKLFMLMHGAYGNLFTAKFATGEKDANGKDKGIRAAMAVWDAALAKYPAEVIEAAALRMQAEFHEFPPNLPQFEALCKAAMPRKTYAEQHGLQPAPALPKPVEAALRNPPGFEPKNDGRDWARRILARKAAGEHVNVCALRMAKEELESAAL